MLLRACYPNDLNLPTRNALKVFGVVVASQKIKRSDEPPPKWWCQLCPCKRDIKMKQQCSECHNHVRKQHSKELRYCYDCVEEEIEDWTFCWAIWHILVVFGLSRHSHSYIYLVKALIFIGLLILFICSWFSVTKISSSSFLQNFCAFLALLFSLFESARQSPRKYHHVSKFKINFQKHIFKVNEAISSIRWVWNHLSEDFFNARSKKLEFSTFWGGTPWILEKTRQQFLNIFLCDKPY